MIGFLRGLVRHQSPPFLILDVNGVGYELQAPMTTFYQLPEGSMYSGKYQESFGVVESRYFKDIEYKIMRNDYSEKYYQGIITDIFNSVDRNEGLPRTPSSYRFPQELIDAIGTVYKNIRDEGK